MKNSKDAVYCNSCNSCNSCGCLLVIFNFLVGGLSVDYCLYTLFNFDMPFIFDMIAGIFIAVLSIPTMVIIYIVKMFG